jgi:pimeloyl-ACP methyl ester carboxylesterase
MCRLACVAAAVAGMVGLAGCAAAPMSSSGQVRQTGTTVGSPPVARAPGSTTAPPMSTVPVSTTISAAITLPTTPPTAGGGGATPPTTTVFRDPPVPASTIAWVSCGSDEQCGTLTVPVDYDDPFGTTLGISVIRHLAEIPAERIGSLVIDPGGPGDSGVDDLPSELAILTPTLLDRFDIVEFDPRGVDRSDPVSCRSSAADDAAPAPNDPVPQTAAQQAALLASDRAYATGCLTGSGASLLANVGTVDAAMDLEVLRQALGDPKLTYFGHSYGTELGAEYAELYPDRVRALLLDGAIDPALSLLEESSQQAAGFESVLDSFFTWCAGSSACPWRPNGDPAAALVAMTDAAGVTPLPAGSGGTANAQAFYTGVLDTLYATSSWPALGRALASAASGDGAPLLALSTSYETHGGSNGADAQMAITCADHPVPPDPAAYPAAAAAAAKAAPYFGPLFAWGALGCAVWPTAPSGTARAVSDPGAPPALVTGTEGDPATPYAWAQALTAQLHGTLLTATGDNHVAYYYSSCVRSWDDAYLVDLTLPPTGTVCPAS